jgi:hypothetical protein
MTLLDFACVVCAAGARELGFGDPRRYSGGKEKSPEGVISGAHF